MSRKRFIETVISTATSNSALRHLPPPLPLCLPYVTNSQRKEAKALCRRAKWSPKQPDNSPLVRYSPKEVEELMFLNVCARDYNLVWNIAQLIKLDPISLRYQTPSVYLLLLLLITAKGDTSQAMLALNLYAELYSGSRKLTEEESNLAAQLVFSILRKCSDFTLLLPLKSIYESIMVYHLDCEKQYIGVTMDILMNSRQYNKTLDLFENYMTGLNKTEIKAALTTLPVLKLFKYMCTVQDCDRLAKWLEVLVSSGDTLLTAADWSTFLGLALSLNNYDLVKLIYDHWIMAGLDSQLSVEDVVLDNKIWTLQSQNSIFQSLSDSSVYQILHTLASHGDVELTLNLIEWHYIHKTLKGDRALTKELCVDIIQSYCFSNDPDSQNSDHSMERVLDVLDSFASRSKANFELSYKDISDAVSHKIHNYKVADENMIKAQRKEMGTIEFIESSNQESVSSLADLPRKISNRNINDSGHGNPLLNTENLQVFIETHIDYLLKKSVNPATIQLFVNCIINHLNKFQNCSGLIVALNTLKSKNFNFINEWLNNDLFEIFVRSIANSPAARLTGQELYQYLKQRGAISQQQQLNFIFSSLRDLNYHSLFEYYVFEYLMSSPAQISSQLIKRISSFSHLDHRGRIVLEFLESEMVPGEDEINEYWQSNGLNKNADVTVYGEESIYGKIDARDCKYLKHVLT
ncbi:CIC11C00000005892 [Sungouiella intermedia]|uniref:CIC11C00000005892 n=1 Tax=Sungouiella intermedia TaxID=45354 RepID=A0A1L0G3I8_9ASCO|nr:CIC11C00000005892 [[Candida] intermedia]